MARRSCCRRPRSEFGGRRTRIPQPVHRDTHGLHVGQLKGGLAVEAAPAAEQRVVGQRGGGVARPQSDGTVLGTRVGYQQLLGIELGRLQHEDMDLAGDGNGTGHVKEAAGRQEAEPEQHQTGWEIQQLVAGVEALENRRQTLGRAGLVDPVPDPAPQPGLPYGVVVEGVPRAVDQPVPCPLPDHVGPVQVVAVEQVGDATALGIERGAFPLAFQHRQPGRERGPVGLGDGLQDGPHHPLDAPGIGLTLGPVHGQEGTAQVAGIRPDDVGRDAIARPRSRGPEMPGQLQGEPAPHPVGGDGQPFRCERVRAAPQSGLRRVERPRDGSTPPCTDASSPCDPTQGVSHHRSPTGDRTGSRAGSPVPGPYASTRGHRPSACGRNSCPVKRRRRIDAIRWARCYQGRERTRNRTR